MSTPTTETAAAAASPAHDRDYTALRAALGRRLAAIRGPLFTTDADAPDGAPPDGPRAARQDALYRLLLGRLDPTIRQQYTCGACRLFVRRFGGLVTLDEAGRATPALWDPADGGETFGPIIEALRDRVQAARVTGVFVHGEAVWGTPEAGGWHHLGGPVHRSLIDRDALATPGQRRAALAHDFETLDRALGLYDRAHVQVALRLLDSEQLYRSEKVLGVAKWLDGLMGALPTRKKGGAPKAGGKKARRRASVMCAAR